MFTTFDTLRAADVTFRADAKRLLIINNSTPQPDDVGHFYSDGVSDRVVALNSDSMALFCTAALTENLEYKGFFEKVILGVENSNVSKDFSKLYPLSVEQVYSLCKKYNVDAVLSLDHIAVKDEIYDAGYNGGVLDSYLYTSWSINYPDGKDGVRVNFADSLSWEAKSVKKLPSRHNALVDAAILSGSNISERLIPRWEQQDRYFFDNRSREMREAMNLFSHKEWSGAIEKWKYIAQSTKKSSLKYQAYNNIAIAYELKGDIKRATKYVVKAINEFNSVIFISDGDAEYMQNLLEYYTYLKGRNNELKLLRKQLAEPI